MKVKWTTETYAVYNEAMREADHKFQEERDRRYREVNIEREKALKIKEVADSHALELAREIQAYKDEKANELREQINAERLLYAKRMDLNSVQEKYDAILKPVLEFVAISRGSEKGTDKTIYYVITAISVLFGLLAMISPILKKIVL